MGEALDRGSVQIIPGGSREPRLIVARAEKSVPEISNTSEKLDKDYRGVPGCDRAGL